MPLFFILIKLSTAFNAASSAATVAGRHVDMQSICEHLRAKQMIKNHDKFAERKEPKKRPKKEPILWAIIKTNERRKPEEP